MKTFVRMLWLWLSVMGVRHGNAQIFGGNPPRVKFFQLDTDTVRVIFPRSLALQAGEIASLVHQLAAKSPNSLGGRQRKFDILLQNQTTLSNAYVGIAPFRSEFFMMPELHNITIGSLPWHHLLAIHENRHMHQYANFNTGIARWLGFFLGQEGQAVAMNAAIPDWFWEGDAVWQETVTTAQGRGRLPFFFNGFRSLWQSGTHYSYMKLRNGSLKDFVPDHYAFGYLMVSYGYEKYGGDFWRKVTQDALKLKGLLYPFQVAVERYSGRRYQDFVKDAFQWYQQQMRLSLNAFDNPMRILHRFEQNNVVFYRYPYEIDTQRCIVLKSSYRQVPAWFMMDADGKEHMLRVKDIADDDYYTYRGGKVVYTAFAPDVRWGWNNYSEVKLWDVATGVTRRLTSKTRLFMPDLSPDLRKVVTVSYTPEQQCQLQVLYTEDETNVLKLPNENNYIYTFPRFNAQADAVIAAVRNAKGEMTLVEKKLDDGAEKLLLPFTSAALAYVQVYGDSIFFTASQSAGDVLYMLHQTTGKLYRVSDLENGNYQATMAGSYLWLTSFTRHGFALLRAPLNALSFQEVAEVEKQPNLYLSPASFTRYPNLSAHIQPFQDTIIPYRKTFRFFNIHSWRPTLLEPDYGLTFFGENVLNTLRSEFFYNYNRSEGYHQLGANWLYGGFFPVLSVGARQTWNRSDASLFRDTVVTWHQSNFNTGISLPLNFTGGRYYRQLQVFAQYNTEQLHFTGVAKTIFNNTSFNYISSGVRWVSQFQQARQHIYPRWAQTFSMQYRRTTNGRFGNQLLLQGGLYLPGIGRNHNFVVFASYQSRDTIRGSVFTNNFPFARGYNVVNFPRMGRWSINYHFPLFYPDRGFAQLAYLQRIRTNLYYDVTRTKSLRLNRLYDFRTVGCEMFFDAKVWNQVPVSLGIRYSYLLNRDFLQPGRSPHQWEVILPLQLF